MPADGPDWQSATDVAPIALGTLSMPQGQTIQSATFTMPGTAAGLAFVLASGILSVLQQLTISGVTTGIPYTNANAANGPIQGVYVVPAMGSVEATVQVQAVLSVAAPGPGPELVGTAVAVNAAGLTAVYTPSAIPLATVPGLPVTILAGSGAAVTGAGTTLITIPAGRVWYGSVGLVIVAAAKSSVQVAGVGATPGAGTLLVEHQLLTLAGAAAIASASGLYVAASRTAAASLAAISSVNATTDAWCNGILV